MKIRKGFVSNSSSSSFVCDACSGIESGWDLCLSDAGMTECVNGHVFHDDHLPEDTDVEDRYECPVGDCPCCQLTYVPKDVVLSYLLHEKKTTVKEVEKEIRARFGTLEKFDEEVGS